MFAPTFSDASTRLTDSYATAQSLTGFANTVNAIAILNLPDEPDWLGPVRTEVVALQKTASSWVVASPGVVSPLLLAFIDYAPQFLALAKTVGTDPATFSKAQWLDLLGTLKTSVAGSITKTTGAKTAVEAQLAAIAKLLPQIDASIQAGWDALADEEQQMLKVAEAMGSFVGKVEDLGVSITASEIGGGKDFFINNVDFIYSGIAEGGAEASIPVIGFVAALFTIGETFYDIIEDDNKLIEDMNQINELQSELSAEAVQVTLTKSTLQTLYLLQDQYLATHDAIPELIDLWQAQSDRVDDAIDAIEAGAEPALYLDIIAIPAAAAVWQQLLDFANAFVSFQAKNGPPVTIDIGAKTITSE
jgi:hypothetical protein